jgi:hypothetical protein
MKYSVESARLAAQFLTVLGTRITHWPQLFRRALSLLW